MTFIVLHIIVYLILMSNTPIQPKYLKAHDPALQIRLKCKILSLNSTYSIGTYTNIHENNDLRLSVNYTAINVY